MVFQNYALWPHLSAVDTVAYPMRRRGMSGGRGQGRGPPDPEPCCTSTSWPTGGPLSCPAVNSSGSGSPGRWPGRRRCTCSTSRPPIWIATCGGCSWTSWSRAGSATGAAALYATHDAEEALGLADRVALLNGGTLVQVGTPQEVYDRPVDLWAARLTGPTSVLALPGQGHVLVRPGWARLGGDHLGQVEAVRFAGPHSDYQITTDYGRLAVRQPGPPQEAVGAEVTWSLDRSWPFGS